MRINIKNYFATWFLLTMSFGVCGSGVNVQLLVDGMNFTENDFIEMSVEVEGDFSDGDVELQNVDAFAIEGRGVSKQISIINGVSRSTRIYNYTLVPKKVGEFTVGPALFKSDGQVYKSEVVRLKIAGQGSGTAPGGAPSQGAESDMAPQQDYYARLRVDKTNPYVNEQMLLTFELYTRVELKVESIEPSSFEGFWFKEIENSQKTYRKNINGRVYRVNELYFLLVPSSSGSFTIKPFQLIAHVANEKRPRTRKNFFNFFNSRNFRRVRFKTNSIPLDVQGLPPVPPNTDFSGLVGPSFKMKSRLSKNNVARGDSVTWQIELKGTGNTQDANLKPPTLNNFKVYEDRPQFKTVIKNKKLVGTKTFKWAIVPQKTGLLRLPSLRVTYFNTQRGAYELLKNPTLQLQVGQAQKGSEEVRVVTGDKVRVAKQDIEVLGKALMPFKKAQAVVQTEVLGALTSTVVYIFSFGAPVFYFVLLMLGKRKEFWGRNEDLLRRESALKTFKKQMNSSLKEESPPLHLLQALKSYVGDRLTLDGQALTKKEILDSLRAHRINGPQLESLEKIIDSCEMAQYGGASTSQNQWAEVMREADQVIQKIHKELGRRS